MQAARGNIECLIYVINNGCKWNKNTCWNTALEDNLNCLIYSYENWCPWNKNNTSNQIDYIDYSTRIVLYIKSIDMKLRVISLLSTFKKAVKHFCLCMYWIKKSMITTYTPGGVGRKIDLEFFNSDMREILMT
jgi:hypothetical protein